MNLSVWRDVRSWNGGQSGSRDMIVGLCDGNRIWRVSVREPNDSFGNQTGRMSDSSKTTEAKRHGS